MPSKLNLVGQVFGRLTVIEEDVNRPPGRSFWICRCECGEVRSVDGPALRAGHTQSCGCYKRDRTSEVRKLNLIGERFGRLIVIEDAGSDPRGKAHWVCRCDCGSETVVIGTQLRNGHTQSCGCLKTSPSGRHFEIAHQTFGRLTVIEEHLERRWGQVVWRCRCECGVEVIALSHLLRSGQTQSCGCLRVETTKARFADLRALRGEEQESHFRRRQRRRRDQRDGKSPNREGVWKRDSVDGESALCRLCRKIVHRSDPWIMEHLIPLWAEGRDSYANVAVVCAPCAKAKTAAELTERARRDAAALRKLAGSESAIARGEDVTAVDQIADKVLRALTVAEVEH